MIRKLLIAATLLTATTAAMAHGDCGYGRVVSVEPRVSISFGTGYYDGFRVLYESGGQHYWTSTPYRPGPAIVDCPPTTACTTSTTTAITIAGITAVTGTITASGVAIRTTAVTTAIDTAHQPVIKGHGVEGDEQLGCVLSRNYLDEAGTVTCPEDAIERFFSEFAIREAEDLIKGVLPEL